MKRIFLILMFLPALCMAEGLIVADLEVTDDLTVGDDVTVTGETTLTGALTVGAYAFPITDGTVGQVLSTDGSGALSWGAAGGATAFDDIGDPDAAGTIAMTTFAQTFTSTKTDGDGFNFQGLGAFGDVSVMRIESKTGNPTDGTVLEVISHDANVDPLVVSTSGQAGVLTVGQGGTVAIVGATSVTGKISASTGVSPGSATDSTLRTDTVEITNEQIKALRASAKELIAAPGADYFIEFVSAVLVLDYGSEALTETADNLVIQYGTSGADVSGAIESGSFIDATADTITFVPPAALVGLAATSAVNDNIVLFNTGDGEFGGNGTGDTTITAKVTYRIHKAGL